MKNVNVKKVKTQFKLSSIIFKYSMIALLYLYAFSLLYVLFWLVTTSIKPIDEYILSPLALPKSWDGLKHYVKIWDKFKLSYRTGKGLVEYGFLDMFTNSFVWAMGCAIVNPFWMAVCGYVCARYKNKLTKFVFSFGIFIMVVPIVGSFPSAMKLYKDLGLYDNMLAKLIIGPCAASFSGMHFLLLYGVFSDLPKEYGESVEIDGGTHFTSMFKIYIPLSLPSIAVLSVLNFVGGWNDYGTFLYWLPSSPNLAYGMYQFQQIGASMQFGKPLIMTGFVITAIPSMILYFASQDLISTKMAVGGIKG